MGVTLSGPPGARAGHPRVISPRLRAAVIGITAPGGELIEAAAPQHVADVRAALVGQLTAAELATPAAIGDQVRRRLAELEPAAPAG